MTEWEFTADVASWINSILDKTSGLPFSEAKCEQRGKGSLKRRDLTLLDKSKRAVLTGEVKLPYAKDGGSPYNAAVVKDARRKARRAKSSFFFTWNVNDCVLWETESSGSSRTEQDYHNWHVTTVHQPSHLEQPMTRHEIQTWLGTFLAEVAQLVTGISSIGHKTPDEKFLEALESSLRLPILLTTEELTQNYTRAKFRTELDKWMRADQGWVIYDDPAGIRENLERAAKFACYALVNKLVFHEALLKRYAAKMAKLDVAEHIDAGDELRLHLERYFADAKEATGDYETVFGEVHTSIGNRIPFYSDSAVVHWRELINQIHEFDFSRLDYEVIGSIFERLISPEERHKFGQFYTRVEVVDLINSFCIRDGSETVMDPACGGGTFLVRAYARKRELAPGRTHGELLSDLYGVDISNFATHLTVINLATRDLIDDENYPQIAREDFFNVQSGKTFLVLPRRLKTRGLGKSQHREIEIPQLDAVIGNPPYVRQEDIPSDKKKRKSGPRPGTKEFYQLLVKREAKVEPSGRSDIHCYFWPHALTFLKDEGYLCFLTSSQWLDVEYGFRLQEWILRHFEIIAILESVDEPWFVGARVATTVTILRRQKDESSRMNNIVRFAQLRRPIRDILAHDMTTAGAITSADSFREEITSLKKNAKNERYRARLVRQGELWKQGVQLGVLVGKSKDAGTEDPDVQDGEYFGGKWGIHLRAPDLWFALLDKYGDTFRPLGMVADVWRGITSGKDAFFFPRDVSSECLERTLDSREFKDEYGVERSRVDAGELSLVACGEGRGEIRPIESAYLQPEVHSLMEISGFSVRPKDCRRQVLLVADHKHTLQNTYIHRYIEWGESKGFHEGATCSARVTDEHPWYDLTGHRRGDLFWSKSHQYKHVVPRNDSDLACNCNLYNIAPPKGIHADVLGGILNSTVVTLSKFQYGRPVGVEGNLKTEVVDVKMMLIPDPSRASAAVRAKLQKAFRRLKKRDALYMLSERRLREMALTQKGKQDELDELSSESELDLEDRRALDDAVFEMIGVRNKKKREELIDDLYSYFREFFESVRRKEEKAIVNKKKAKRRGPAKPGEIASQVYEDILNNVPAMLKKYDPDFVNAKKPCDTFELPTDGEAELHQDMFTPHGVRFVKGKKTLVKEIETKVPEQDELIVLVAKSGVRGLVRVPRDGDELQRVRADFGRFLARRDKTVREMIEERTADEDLQEKIYSALLPLLARGSRDE
jgi:hypothetical protein